MLMNNARNTNKILPILQIRLVCKSLYQLQLLFFSCCNHHPSLQIALSNCQVSRSIFVPKRLQKSLPAALVIRRIMMESSSVTPIALSLISLVFKILLPV
jgi:hypothetical protein